MRGWIEVQDHSNGSTQSHILAKAKGTLTLHPLQHINKYHLPIQSFGLKIHTL